MRKLLDEVIVIGYWCLSKKNLTTSIAKAKADEVHKAATSNMSQMLLGVRRRFAGNGGQCSAGWWYQYFHSWCGCAYLRGRRYGYARICVGR